MGFSMCRELILRKVKENIYGICRKWDSLWEIKKTELSPERIKKILVIRLDMVGDLILSLPALEVLRMNYSQAHLTLVANPYTCSLVKDYPIFDEVLIYDENKKCRTVRKQWAFINLLRKKRFDLAIDLIYAKDIWPSALAFLSRAKYRLGFDVGLRRFFLNIRVVPENCTKYDMERNLELIGQLGLQHSVDVNDFEELRILDKDRDYIESLISGHKISNSSLLIGINATASVKNKMWPKENFIELIDKIMDFFKTKVNIILTGGPSDVEYIKSMAKEIKIQPLIVAGQTSLSQLCALISRLDLLITNCTAPLHIAELLDIPSVAILGPSLRERWTRRNHRHVVLQTNGLDCCPCEKRWCIFKETVCLTSITVDDVFASTLKLLDESPVP